MNVFHWLGDEIKRKHVIVNLITIQAVAPFTDIDLIPAWIDNHMPNKVWGEITYTFPNVNGYTPGVWKLKVI